MPNFDDATKAQVVIAASIIAGPNADEAAVTTQVRAIVSRLSEGSPSMNAFDEADKRDEATEKVKTFRGVILHVDKEVTSERAVIFLKTQPSKYHPNGKEFARTERTDTPAGKAVAKQAQALVGHQVQLSVGIEGTGEVKVRVIRHIEDQGPIPGFDPNTEEYAADFATEPKNGNATLSKLVSAQAAAARQQLGVAPHEKLRPSQAA